MKIFGKMVTGGSALVKLKYSKNATGTRVTKEVPRKIEKSRIEEIVLLLTSSL